MSSWTRRVRVALTLTGSGAGCTGSGPGNPVMIRDSADITIVESSASLFRATPPWVVDSLPVLDIGADQTDPHQQLTRIAGPVMLSDGRIVVGDGGTEELRVYDSTGGWLETWGRKGRGPGEFEELDLLFHAPTDTLFAFEYSNGSLSTITAAGTFTARVRLASPVELRAAYPAGILDDGRLVVLASAFVVPGSRPGVHRDPLIVYLGFRDGSHGDSIGPLPGSESIVSSTATSVAVMGRPFGRTSVVAVGGDRFYVGLADGFGFEVRDRTGRVTRIIRRVFEETPVTREDMDRLIAERYSNVPASRQGQSDPFRKMLADAPLPAAKPPFVDAVVSTAGDLWVEEFTDPGVERRTYSVFDSTGRWLGQVSMPPRFQPVAIMANGALGIWRDEDDLPHVRRYRMRASAR